MKQSLQLSIENERPYASLLALRNDDDDDGSSWGYKVKEAYRPYSRPG